MNTNELNKHSSVRVLVVNFGEYRPGSGVASYPITSPASPSLSETLNPNLYQVLRVQVQVLKISF